MSLSKWPSQCPRCESKDFTEIGRVEGGPDTQPDDVAIYSCGDCGLEFSTDDVPDRPQEQEPGREDWKP